MNRLALTIRFLFFMVFFVAGAFAIVLAMLARPELYDYYRNRAALEELAARNERIVELTSQYAGRIEVIESNPEILARLSASTFGRKPAAPDTVFPAAASAQLRAETEKMLAAEMAPAPADPLPAWMNRVIKTSTRTALFLAGAALIMITFIFFGSPEKTQMTCC